MLKKTLALAATAATTALIAAAPSGATGLNYTVTAPTNFTAATTGVSTFTLQSGPVMTCSGISVNATKGPGNPDIANINSSTWSGCSYAGIALNVTQVDTWKVHGTTAATAANTDIITGHIDNVRVTVASAIPGLCSFTVAGATSTTPTKADGSFDESTQVLAVNEVGFNDLTIYNASGCGGAVTNGTKANFTSNFKVTAPLYLAP